MKPEIKKLLILNLPYLLFVWLFDTLIGADHYIPTVIFFGSKFRAPVRNIKNKRGCRIQTATPSNIKNLYSQPLNAV